MPRPKPKAAAAARRPRLETLVERTALKAGPPAARPAPAAQPELDLAREDLAAIGNMIGLAELLKQLGAQHDLLRSRARGVLFRAFTAAFWQRRKKPANARVVVAGGDGQADHDTLYQLREQFALGSFGDRDQIIEALAAPAPADAEDAPLGPAEAGALVAAEIESRPILRLRYSLSELVEGHRETDGPGGARFVAATAAEKAIAAKLLAFLLAQPAAGRGGRPQRNVTVAALTDEERALLLVKDPRLCVKDPPGLMRRACDYVASLPQLRRLLLTLRPTQVFSSSHFALAATGPVRSQRLLAIARAFLGNPAEVPDEPTEGS